MQKSRVFVAIPISDAVKTGIRKELDKLSLSSKLIPEKNYHLTVLFLGDIDNDELESLQQSLTNTAQSISSFSLTTQSLTTKSNPHYHMLWVTFNSSIHFEKLAAQVALSLNASLSKKPVPHINLTRSKKKITGRFPLKIEEMEVPVNKIELWRSTLHADGATYSVLGSFNLK